jgi:hypothetical protein
MAPLANEFVLATEGWTEGVELLARTAIGQQATERMNGMK